MKTILISIATVAGLTALNTAHAGVPGAAKGYWTFNPARCPDLVEDRLDRRESRRDEAFDHGPLDVLEDYVDRKESKRDMAVTRCPASAWVWHGPAYHAHIHPARPKAVTVYYNVRTRTYYRYGSQKKRIVVIRP